jgi:hypothetical protein
MDRSRARKSVSLAAFVAAGVVASIPSLAGPGDDEKEATVAEVRSKALEVGRSMRAAEEALARSLDARRASTSGGESTKDAGASLAKFLDAMRDDGRRASAAMQWIMDNAPQ